MVVGAAWPGSCSPRPPVGGSADASYSGTTLPTPAAPNGVTRTYNSYSQSCHEIVDARVWSGIHFPFTDEEAAKLGRRVAHWGTRHAFP
jgi:hypothetical protein